MKTYRDSYCTEIVAPSRSFQYNERTGNSSEGGRRTYPIPDIYNWSRRRWCPNRHTISDSIPLGSRQSTEPATQPGL
jgi:hypothetical protein